MILALDLGTTSNRAIVFDKDGSIAAMHQIPLKQYYPKPGWVEHDANEIWDATKTCIRSVLSKVPASNIKAIGITNQRESTILWDKGTGKPIANCIVWQCRRTVDICKAFERSTGTIKEKTGLILDAYFSASKIKWLLDHVPEARTLIDKNALAFGTVDTWVLYKLTGQRVHATDTSNASRTMLYNIHDLNWDTELLDLFQIPATILPDVLPSDSLFGETHIPEIDRALPIHAILGDQQASLFAHDLDTGRTLKNTYGTGLFVVANTKTNCPDTEKLVNTIAWTIQGRTSYALEGSIFVGGSAIQWLRDGLGFFDDSADSEALANSVDDTDGVYVVPALVGLGAPYWDGDARGIITGLTRGSTKAHITRATLEALAYQTRDVVDEIKGLFSVFPYASLSVDGGATQNDFLMQFQANQLALPVERPKIMDTTAFGVASLAGITSGLWTISDIQKMNPIETRFEPVLTPEIAEADNTRYNHWKHAVKKALSQP